MEKSQEKYPNLISAEILADSLNQFGERITTMKLVFPRIILAEFNTHRMFNRNSASSRAIPFKKMVKIVEEQPFIPIAWQKDHKGMQGTEYAQYPDTEDFKVIWLEARDNAIKSAQLAQTGSVKLTKQLCNRLLEPFMWTTVLLTSSKEGLDNFFNLRAGNYGFTIDGNYHQFKSKKELLGSRFGYLYKDNTDLQWLQMNKGQAEIHIMDLAEKIYDAVNESIPRQLEVGQWHIPFGDDFDINKLKEIYISSGYNPENPTPDNYYFKELDNLKLKIAVARCARISYETLGDNPVVDYKKDIELHDTLFAIKHMSPFEHCAVVMEEEEYIKHIKTSSALFEDSATEREGIIYNDLVINDRDLGWSRNLKGFKQYREIIE